jgi:hypothetical protein
MADKTEEKGSLQPMFRTVMGGGQCNVMRKACDTGKRISTKKTYRKEDNGSMQSMFRTVVERCK